MINTSAPSQNAPSLTSQHNSSYPPSQIASNPPSSPFQHNSPYPPPQIPANAPYFPSQHTSSHPQPQIPPPTHYQSNTNTNNNNTNNNTNNNNNTDIRKRMNDDPELKAIRNQYQRIENPYGHSMFNPLAYNKKVDDWLEKYYKEEGPLSYGQRWMENNYNRVDVEWKPDGKGGQEPTIYYDYGPKRDYAPVHGQTNTVQQARYDPKK